MEDTGFYNVEADPTEIVACTVTYCWLLWSVFNKLMYSNRYLLNITFIPPCRDGCLGVAFCLYLR
jgi:hypothetical protein